jgi:hypothetical protein
MYLEEQVTDRCFGDEISEFLKIEGNFIKSSYKSVSFYQRKVHKAI